MLQNPQAISILREPPFQNAGLVHSIEVIRRDPINAGQCWPKIPVEETEWLVSIARSTKHVKHGLSRLQWGHLMIRNRLSGLLELDLCTVTL